MIGLLVLITILLVVIIIWMIAITMLYLSLAKSLQKFAQVDALAILELFERQDGIVGICQKVLDNFQLMEELVEKYTGEISEQINSSSKDKSFALETIQQARRLQNQLEKHLKKEPFVFEEPEEDPEEPRS